MFHYRVMFIELFWLRGQGGLEIIQTYERLSFNPAARHSCDVPPQMSRSPPSYCRCWVIGPRPSPLYNPMQSRYVAPPPRSHPRDCLPVFGSRPP